MRAERQNDPYAPLVLVALFSGCIFFLIGYSLGQVDAAADCNARVQVIVKSVLETGALCGTDTECAELCEEGTRDLPADHPDYCDGGPQ
jgi:hypothetical protein